MCGIVGYVGNGKRMDQAREDETPGNGTRASSSIQELLLGGLRRLEYRGYDSAGISVIEDDHIASVRAVGNLDALQAKLYSAAAEADAGAHDGGGVALATRPATTGIGHTRWATHGRVSERNAHPHHDSHDHVHVVVNGIVENYVELRNRLTAAGCTFTSETDAETIAHLIAHHYDGDLADAVRAAYAELEGHYAFVAMSLDEPDVLVGARCECPLIVGRGEGEQFVASAVPAFLAYTRRVQFLDNDEIVVLQPDGVTITTPSGEEVDRPVEIVDWDEDAAEKGGYETFMLKEIHEQADAVAETIADRTAAGDGVNLREQGAFDESLLAGVSRIVVVACGTSYHAGLIGRYAIEEWARLPVEMDIASEFRYRNPVLGPDDLVVGISQSGETADTLAAMRMARDRGARVLAITNVMGSQATRDADGVLFTRAGLEIGVAATKTFLCQVAVMYLLGLRLAQLRGTLPPERVMELVSELKRLPHGIAALTGEGGHWSQEGLGEREGIRGQVQAIADANWRSDFFLYIGRHIGLPVALEGALKLKEISYIATDAYAAGEMKHGPIALLDEHTPVVAVATDSPVLDKIASNMQEVRARGAHVIAIATAGDDRIGEYADSVISVPAVDWMLQPMLAVVPLQLLAYEVARRRGLNVDQPRNLAKTVTVE